MSRQLAIATVIVAIVMTGTALAGDYQAGTESPLKFGAGARELSLGGANLARCDGTTAAFWNPARLTGAEYYSVSGFHTTLFDSDVSFQYLGATLPTLDFGVFGFGIQRLGIDNIEHRDEDNLLLGHFSDSRLGIYLGYGRLMGEYEIGLSVHMEHHSLESYNATSTPGLNLSVGRSFGTVNNWLHDIDAVVSIKNIIRPSLELDQEAVSEPWAMDAGFSCDLWPHLDSDHRLELSTRLNKIDKIDMAAALGLEYTYAGILSLRGGIRKSDLSGGLGIGLSGFRFDYSLVNRELGLLHMFSLTSSFGTSTTERRAHRAMEREADFQHQMNIKIATSNAQTVESLAASGEAALGSGDLVKAVEDFEKALFIARASGLDTVTVSERLIEASDRLERTNKLAILTRHLDFAHARMEMDDLLGARYHANLALETDPRSAEAETILAAIDVRLQSVQQQDEMIRRQIGQIDSLMTYGRFDEAVARARSLSETDPENKVISQLLRRARFEALRSLAEQAFAVGKYDRALGYVAEVDQLVPNHQWSVTLRSRIDEAYQLDQLTTVSFSPLPRTEVSESLRRQVEIDYRAAQQSFEVGALEDAIAGWERVEQLVPGFGSVRESLVKAYKYLGVERYGKNDLNKAIAVWRRAAELAPDNTEIRAYIQRTESEIARLRELTYEQ